MNATIQKIIAGEIPIVDDKIMICHSRTVATSNHILQIDTVRYY